MFDVWPEGTATDTVHEKAVEVMEAMRLQEITAAARGNVKGSEEIGIFVQVTTVIREAITSRIVHRWPSD